MARRLTPADWLTYESLTYPHPEPIHDITTLLVEEERAAWYRLQADSPELSDLEFSHAYWVTGTYVTSLEDTMIAYKNNLNPATYTRLENA